MNVDGFMPLDKQKTIRLRGVRQNNLKNLDLDLPLGKLIVVTGLSGTGKSSLVFDTLHAEGQRRYVETFSAYTRQFMEMLDRPKVDSVENIRPSIAIEQGNTVKTSRSTVGTMTELCDYFKVWFAHSAELLDPVTGKTIVDDNPVSIWRRALQMYHGKTVLLAFSCPVPENMSIAELVEPLRSQGYTRAILEERVVKLDSLPAGHMDDSIGECVVIQDRLTMESKHRDRFMDSARTALHFGQGKLQLHAENGTLLQKFSQGLHSPETGRTFRAAAPNLFSFNSPLGACPACRGFGRVIEVDYRLVIPDHSLSIRDGAIRAFSGSVYSESNESLIIACQRKKIPVDVPWAELSEVQQRFVIDGDPEYVESFGRENEAIQETGGTGKWYGVKRFFEWLESNTYKMHVRVFLSRYRSYITCPECGGARLQAEALNWRWRGHTLPDLYRMSVNTLLELLEEPLKSSGGSHQLHIACEALLTRLRYLKSVGLGYLTLDRSSRTLSGGETQRVNLTACLGTALVDTLFVLDEPSVGLHARDVGRLIDILRSLTAVGNTVVVVEHDEAIMAAADWLIELGPEPGKGGGYIVAMGPVEEVLLRKECLSARYLTGDLAFPKLQARRPMQSGRWPALRVRGASKHNLSRLDVDLPLQRLVVLTGVSGSGKSTLLNNVIYQGWLAQSGQSCEEPAAIESYETDTGFSEVVLIDQSPVSKTPRSNAALFVDVWSCIVECFASTIAAANAGFSSTHFTFNSASGRCPQCSGLGYEKVEMQFMADLYLPCATCEGKRFIPEVLNVRWRDYTVDEVLALTVLEALEVFQHIPKVKRNLSMLVDVGLGYLPIGQPLNTLSGGEAQRLKLVKYLQQVKKRHGALILIDEPTTGLHRHDVVKLLNVLQRLVDAGHSVVLIEHHLDVIGAADWVLEIGPEAGAAGGRIVFAGTPARLRKSKTATAPFLLQGSRVGEMGGSPYAAGTAEPAQALQLTGAREHNLKNLSLAIPHGKMTVVTGISGSGKSTLAFDIIFAEGQRRFMESMSSYARQYVEQMARPDIDQLTGIQPTVAIEQRITRGSRKSTVATITEVAQYLRLLYARIGIQHSFHSDQPLITRSPEQLLVDIANYMETSNREHGDLVLLAPLVRGRKGSYQALLGKLLDEGYKEVRIDGKITALKRSLATDRFVEHDIEVVMGALYDEGFDDLIAKVPAALRLGEGVVLLTDKSGEVLASFSAQRTDPVTGQSYPELEPKLFSWNTAKGWCPCCTGHGRIYPDMLSSMDYTEAQWAVRGTKVSNEGVACPKCNGQRLSPVARAVYLYDGTGRRKNLPDLLTMTPTALLQFLENLNTDGRSARILAEVLPEIRERLAFMQEVGLGYLTLDRSTNTLSGGEAQRIRLASQLGSNLSGVLYVLDEPSIGLHARDNHRLLQSLHRLRAKNNTLLVVEHDPETMRHADWIIDLGPGAGRMGGELLACGSPEEIMNNPKSVTGSSLREGIPHPLRGSYRKLPKRGRTAAGYSSADWLVLEEPRLRNLKGGLLTIPKGRLTLVCGISGAGKSTLIRDLLKPAVQRFMYPISKEDKKMILKELALKNIRGVSDIGKVIEVDQDPIGKTPRSTPATYIGVFDAVRKYFGNLPDAKMRGFEAGSFSFNTTGGRCENCKGAGVIKLEMSFMPDSYITCEDCGGLRYGPDMLAVEWKGKNISQVLDMSFTEAAEFFSASRRIKSLCDLMIETGLGYLTLGQTSPTLSGGEAQRLKLVSELVQGVPTAYEMRIGYNKRNLYILEEPTIGLHMRDCQKLIELLHRLVDQGHTVVVIEHNTDVIAEADYVVEIGPEGGDAGGEIIYQGPVDGLRQCTASRTAPYLPNAKRGS